MTHRSAKSDILAPRSQFYQGPFGRLCSDLPGWRPAGVSDDGLDAFFQTFAKDNMTEAPGETSDSILADDALRQQLDQQFNSQIPAGYTYFGQFIDHDITFDPISSLMRQADPNALLNFRTPRLDLDNLYGRGAADQPYLYEDDGRRLLVGSIEGSNLPDLPRNQNGRALIGDMRNDENAMVAQLQLAFILAHNTLVQRAEDNGTADPFGAAQRTLRWLYQWIVWNDFLGRITDPAIHECALKRKEACGGGKVWKRGLNHIYNWKHRPFMPVEFSVAAYRFGHSMVRNSYQANATAAAGLDNFIPIFSGADPDDDLHGFRPLAPRRFLQWNWFLEMSSSQDEFPQKARKIDDKLSNALLTLGEEPGDPASILNVLAARNLLRGVRFELPSGPDLCRKYCLEEIALSDEQLPGLWPYILAEAGHPDGGDGERLGVLGSTILCATFAGLLTGDPHSFFNLAPCWTPDSDPLLEAGDNVDPGDWTLASIIRLSGLPVEADDL